MGVATGQVDNLGGLLSVIGVGSAFLAINFGPVSGRGMLVLVLALFAVAALAAFARAQRRAPNPLYDLRIARRRIFWVAASGGIVVFGALMGAVFIGQQFLQDVLGYSPLESGAAIVPAAALMVLIAPRSATLVATHRSRFTLLTGYFCCLLGFLSMLLPWTTNSSCWQVGLAYAFIGVGVGFAGTPASHPLTSSVPVTRAGMASGTADLQSELTKSFASASQVARTYPRYASQITAAAKSAFPHGDRWAFAAGMLAVLAGAAIVRLYFPHRQAEQALIQGYHAEDTATGADLAL